MSARPILTAAETRAAEVRAMAAGASVDLLMERAGAAVAEAVLRFAGTRDVLILCGPGNNGGDGYVAARYLRAAGVSVRIAASADPRTDAAQAARALWGGEVAALDTAEPAPVLVDALFGTGLKRPLEDAVAERFTALAVAAALRVAIDLPSGIESDTGALLTDGPGFDLTVALGALKPAHRLMPSAARCGRVAIADIGLDIADDHPLLELGRPHLDTPPPSSNKYARGKLVVVGGSMTGASALVASAAQRAGAGYVELAGDPVGGVAHALVQRPWTPHTLDDPRIRAVAIGPGLGADDTARVRLDAAFACGKPLLLDADALTLVGHEGHERLRGHVVTPHWGEFVRLFGDSGADRLSQARAAAASSGAIVLLKGSDSTVAHPDGRAATLPLAPSWLASAGTGDVLSGIIGALLAQGLDPFAAAKAGVWLHAEAARIAGPMLIADDLIAVLPRAMALCL
ncbi:NAD(P)H-hydrate dehydratase [Sphingomonas nostoxanthinifaciens]|uniref:NAD(P)H-hydrate dehydratase n=1 Tax=Sphingomonas nostoxanthinifaciens TaxID=2872652 RepID=UPI001CC1C919|nr:NAD(P)H-hydrate dehydratase [Sphingomonas nostoxanthinifaciens]UAK26207.1 NAD(P)H-hydrate dehydratase [Sphingomonas nostoxanthinifaciens]